MGCLSAICKMSGVFVVVLAVALGGLFSGFWTRMGVFDYLDKFEGSRGPFFKGMFPALHANVPWEFTADQIPDLTGLNMVVTGANSGLGYWTAYHLANNNANVVLACRTMKKCEAAVAEIKASTKGTGTMTPMVLDLSSFDSIRSFATAILPEMPTIDSLVLNAGVMVPPFTKTKEGIELQIGTNHFGHFLLTELLLPQVRSAATARGVSTIVSVSSAAHYDSYPEGIRLDLDALNDEALYDKAKAYGQSKLANVLFAQELAVREASNNVLSNSIHPGGVDTELGRHIEAVIRANIGNAMADQFQSMLTAAAWHPRDAALTQVFTAVAPAIKEGKITGKYYHPIARLTKPDPHTFNMTLQKGLWELSEAVVAKYS